MLMESRGRSLKISGASQKNSGAAFSQTTEADEDEKKNQPEK